MRYPNAIWAPWYYNPSSPAFYKNGNSPAAVVHHRMEGYTSTVLSWAATGFTGASFHFSIDDGARGGIDGQVYQHLELYDGGYQAGITTNQALSRPPTWSLWRGPYVNVNGYTLGIEYAGFSGTPLTPAQEESGRQLCLWLRDVVGIPLDYAHHPPHAEIDVVNRANCFNPPDMRAAHYAYLLQEDDMLSPDDIKMIQEGFAGIHQTLGRLESFDYGAENPNTPHPDTIWGFLYDLHTRLRGLEDKMATGSHLHS